MAGILRCVQSDVAMLASVSVNRWSFREAPVRVT